jgi:hypothetical protein
MLTPAEVQELRAVQESAMAETCVIRDPSHKSSGKGQEWSSPGRTVICGVSSLAQAMQSGLVIAVPDLIGNESAFVFALPVTAAPVEQGARIEWAGHSHEVRSVELPGTYAMQVQAVGVRR